MTLWLVGNCRATKFTGNTCWLHGRYLNTSSHVKHVTIFNDLPPQASKSESERHSRRASSYAQLSNLNSKSTHRRTQYLKTKLPNFTSSSILASQTSNQPFSQWHGLHFLSRDAKMKEVIVHPTPELWTEIREVEIPKAGADEVVIRVVVAGSNVKDWLHPTRNNISLNSGDDVAGTIHEIGSEVLKAGEFKVGDRVAGFHVMGAPHGAFGEYSVVPAHTVFKIPEGISFEEASTLPLITTTAALILFRRQHLPPPWSPRPSSSSPPTPLIIYGATSALGTTSIKLALASNIHPIIAIGGGSSTHLLPLLNPSLGDVFIDYRLGTETWSSKVREVLEKYPDGARNAIDCISANKSWIPISQLLTPSSSTNSQPSTLSVIIATNKYDEEEINKGVKIVYTYVGTAHTGAYIPTMPKQPEDKEEVKGDKEFAYVFFRYLGRMLGDGRLSGHPFEVVEGGLEGVGVGLKKLKEEGGRGRKFVFRIGGEGL